MAEVLWSGRAVSIQGVSVEMPGPVSPSATTAAVMRTPTPVLDTLLSTFQILTHSSIFQSIKSEAQKG